MSKGSKSGNKTSKTSSGRRRMTCAKRALRRVEMKIARWERNQENPEKKPPKWSKDQNVRLRSRHNEWNTEGLKRHAELLRSIIKKCRKTKDSRAA